MPPKTIETTSSLLICEIERSQNGIEADMIFEMEFDEPLKASFDIIDIAAYISAEVERVLAYPLVEKVSNPDIEMPPYVEGITIVNEVTPYVTMADKGRPELGVQLDLTFQLDAECDLYDFIASHVEHVRFKIEKSLIGGLVVMCQAGEIAPAFNWDMYGKQKGVQPML